jgi:hypothetical protein
MAASMTGAWIVIGDFNLIRFPNEKNNVSFDYGLAATFNALIHDLAWFELPLHDRLYTWTNNQEVPVLARLDRLFFNSNWNSLFPNSHLSSLPRPISDHNPIVVSAGTSIPTSPIFRFENSWLLDPLFLQTTLPGWGFQGASHGAVHDLAACIKGFRAAAKVWKKNHRFTPHFDNNCCFIIDLVKFLEECRPVSGDERGLRSDAKL